MEYKTRAQIVADQIRQLILSGEIPGGQPLRQTALADQLNVSRIPVREALLQLEAEGIVKFEAHKGAVATELSAKECRELFELRAMIEADALKHAISNQTDDDLAIAEHKLQQLDQLLESGTSIDRWSDLNFEFHYALYVAADRPLTLEMIKSLNSSSARYIRLQLLINNGIPQAEEEHRQLLELCRKKDKQAACKLIKRHIKEAGKDIANLIAKQLA
ncbi:MAG: GntR family transcriptional regulator [Kangiellaceae bacterium]|nr:GntR family transcriptional regulator [Kangiellaceae bacterium]